MNHRNSKTTMSERIAVWVNGPSPPHSYFYDESQQKKKLLAEMRIKIPSNATGLRRNIFR